MTEPVYLLDGYSLIYRSYFAFMGRHLTAPDGRNTSAVFGFFRTLISFLDEYNPGYFAVVMDSRTPTFRHERYPDYKATREKAPEELHDQVPVITNILDALGVRVCRIDGFEADDLMATLAEDCRRDGRPCRIITGDKDLMQLVGDGVIVLKPEKSGYSELDSAGVVDKVGVRPDQIVDYLALTGDQADNVPGVRGIGPKTAVKLLADYETLDGVYDNLENLPAGQRKKLEENRDNAYLSRELVILQREVDLGLTPDDLKTEHLDRAAAAELLEKEGAHSLVEKLTGARREGELFDQVEPGESGPGKSATEKPGAGTSGSGKASASPAAADNPQRGEWSVITTEKDLSAFIQEAEKAGTIALDTETDSLDEMNARLVGISAAFDGSAGYYIPLACPEGGCLPQKAVLDALNSLMTGGKVSIVGQNIKYDYKVLKRSGVEIVPFFDTMIAAWILDSHSGSYGMDNLAQRVLDYRTIHYGDIVPKGSTIADVPLEQAAEYAAEDACITFRLYDHYRRQLEDTGLDDLFFRVEMPLVKILGDMELLGIRIRSDVLIEYGKELGTTVAGIEKEIFSLCGHEFNVNSTKQLQEVLFEERKLRPVKKTKTGYSTDISVLQELASEDPAPALVLRHRTLNKLKSTYVDTLPALIHPETGRIHTRFNQTGTATGRLSSRDPNLQNIPVREEEGRRIRSAFIADEGWVFISADYSQIELVVLAHLSGDEYLQNAFHEGADIHRQTAALLFDVPTEEVTPEQRRIAKTINFGVMYGMSAFRLSNELSIPRSRADEFINEYYRRFKGIRAFKDKTVRAAEQQEYVTTLLGRRRPVPGINSRNRTEKAAVERIAVNTPIQGTAADLVKLAMLKTTEALRKEGLETRLLLQVHDELIFEAPAAEQAKAEECIRREMEQVVTLSVPLKVNIETGTSWGEFH